MKIPFSPPLIIQEDIDSVVEVLKSGWITTGPKTKEFEKALASFCHTNKVACLNSATAAMELTLRLLGIGEGDEVITCAYTYTASASVIHHVGAKIVLVDVKAGTYEMDLKQLADKITDKTKAIIAVDLAGVMCDYSAIKDVVLAKKDLFKANNELQAKLGRIAIIADAAHSLGAISHGKISGEVADFTSFSFHAVKNLTTAEGGALTWNLPEQFDDEAIYKDLMILSLHGQTKDALAKSGLSSWEYDILSPAYKCNMTDINAALGLSQLKRYEATLNYRFELIALYNELLKDTKIKPIVHSGKDFKSSGHLYITNVEGYSLEERNDLIIKLAEQGIATNVHYKPLPLLSAYQNLGFKIEDYPNSYAMYQNELTLPLNCTMSLDDVRYIATKLKELGL